MNTLMVSYDLHKPVKDYPRLLEKLRSYGTFWHHLDSLWIVKSGDSATQMRDALKAYVDSDDELLVVNISNDAWASLGFTDKATTWLREHLCA